MSRSMTNSYRVTEKILCCLLLLSFSSCYQQSRKELKRLKQQQRILLHERDSLASRMAEINRKINPDLEVYLPVPDDSMISFKLKEED